MTKVFVAIPTTNWVVDCLPHTLRVMQEKYKDQIELVYPKHVVRRFMHDFARNALVDEFLESDCDVFWFIDSDVTPHPDSLEVITKHGSKWLAAGCPYPVFMTHGDNPCPVVLFTVYRENGTGGLGASKIPDSGTDWVAGVGTGCMFLKRELFERLEKPYFQFKYSPTDCRPEMGEDLGFCLKLKDLGIPFFVDFSLVSKHQKTVDLLDVNNYAINYAKSCIENYHKNMQSVIQEALAAKAEAKRPRSSLILPGRI